MPVTAKLSKEFYEKFGNSVVDELVNWFNQVDATYRSELRELNELNFARFEAKLEAGLARLEGGLLARIGMAEGRLARLMVTMTLTLWVATLGALIALIKL
jgi:hypothetical protein